MSYPTRQPATRREQVKVWFKERKAAGIHWLLLLAAVAFTTVAYDAWFLGVVALAWHHIVPTVKWYYSVGTGAKRDLGWMFGRFMIFAITAGVFTWLCIDEGFAIAVILPVLGGISFALYKKRDWTMLGAIWLGVFMFAEFSNGASLAAAVILFAVINYERKKARLANTFDEVELPARPDQDPRPYQDEIPVDRTQFTGQHTGRFAAPQPQPFPGDGREETGYAGPRTGRFAAPQPQPFPGDGREETGYAGPRTGRFAAPQPQPFPGDGREETGHTTAFALPADLTEGGEPGQERQRIEPPRFSRRPADGTDGRTQPEA